MPFKKGRKKTGGRKKGVTNKATQDVREAYKSFVEGNIGNLEAWMKRVAAEDPGKALDFMLKFSEYFIPKANKVEVSDREGNVIWTIQNAPDLPKT